jgi:uncharacterized protein (DUF2249 family)
MDAESSLMFKRSIKMNKNKVHPTLVILLALVCVSLLTACGSFGPIQAKAAGPEEIVNRPNLTQFNADEIAAYRWNAIAEGYAKMDLPSKPLLTQLNYGEITAFRWNAIAEGYAKMDLPSKPLLTQLNHGEIAAFRWNAIAEGYAKMDLPSKPLLTQLNHDEIAAFRWNAIARAYEEMDLSYPSLLTELPQAMFLPTAGMLLLKATRVWTALTGYYSLNSHQEISWPSVGMRWPKLTRKWD